MTLTPEVVAGLLTAAGAVVASTAIWAAIDMLKSVAPGLVSGREKLVAFLGSIGIVVFALAVGLAEAPPRYPAATLLDMLLLVASAVVAVYGIARLAMAVHDDVNRKPNSLLAPSAEQLAADAAQPVLPPGGQLPDGT